MTQPFYFAKFTSVSAVSTVATHAIQSREYGLFACTPFSYSLRIAAGVTPRPTISSAQRAGYHQRGALHIIRDEVAAYHQPNRAGYHQRKALHIIRDEVAAYHQPKGLDITNAERCISSATKLRHTISPVGWISPLPTRNRRGCRI